MRKSILFFIVLIIIIALITFLFTMNKPKSIIGNKEILNQINSLLVPLEAQNITVSDFNVLREQVKGDSYASGEVNELIVLTKYKEYSHIGHGLGFLYEYIKTGNQHICPGHLLSHYYVFMKHNESTLAENNFNDSISIFSNWTSFEEAQNQTYLLYYNYTYYSALINNSISSINAGITNTSEDNISALAEAPCART